MGWPKGKPRSAETRAKISATQKGRGAGRKLTPEHCEAMRKARAGKKLSPSHREAIRAALNRPEVKAKISAASKGRKPSAETLRKRGIAISKAKTGKPRPDMRGDRNPMRRPEIAALRSGPANNRYREVPNYGGLHDRLDYQRGLASTYDCEVCGKCAKHWALWHEAEEVVTNGGGQRYSLNLSDYIAMCGSCHIRYDRGWLSL